MVSLEDQEKMKAVLKKNGYKLTQQRLSILKVLFENDYEHMTVEEIYHVTKITFPKIGISTVYKSICCLEKSKILVKIKVNDSCSRYEFVHPNEQSGHPHLLCINCKKAIGIVDDEITCLLNKSKQLLKSRYSFEINSQSILYYGICRKCRIDLNEAIDQPIEGGVKDFKIH
jgi:Fur family ferric uptake transcriptional regulator